MFDVNENIVLIVPQAAEGEVAVDLSTILGSMKAHDSVPHDCAKESITEIEKLMEDGTKESVRLGHHYVSNSYYDARLHVYISRAKETSTPRQVLADLPHPPVAVIYVIDSESRAENPQETVTWLNTWREHFDSLDREVDINMLVNVSYIPESTDDFEHWIQWCVSNGTEFVQIDSSGVAGNPSPGDGESNDDNGFDESKGIDRLLEALEAHMWPAMNPATARAPRAHERNLNADGEEEEEMPSIGRIRELDDSEFGPDDGTFEGLLGHLSDLRAKAESMPDEQRKDFAERVALAFLERMDFTEDDLEDLAEIADLENIHR
eukprot:Clim_evm88s128 gene=Clim_evmTU88s128